MTAIAVRGLRKSYGALEAVGGIDFEVQRGEVFGLLGPNGAGKTTTVEILEGYRKRDGGEVEVLGTDPARAGGDWREQIGVVLQSSAMYETLTPTEMLRLFAGYYREPRPVDEVIELVGLQEKRDDRVRRLSGGQRRRLDLGLALIGDPELIFLDEPTTGFDPGARRRAWETIRGLRGLGKTILLTTHYLDEAEQLADRVAVLAHGRIVASGTPAELTGAVPATEIRYRENGSEVVLETDEPTRLLNELTGRALAEGRELEGLVVRRPSARGGLPEPDRGERRVRLYWHELKGELLLYTRSRELAFFTFLLPMIFFVLLGSTYGHDTIDGRQGLALPRGRDDRLRRDLDRLRGPRDRARHPARVGDPEAAARDASARAGLHRGAAGVVPGRLRGRGRRPDPARPRLVRDPGSRPGWLAGAGAAARRGRLLRARDRRERADQERRRRLRGRERDLPAGVVHRRRILLGRALPLRCCAGSPTCCR